MVRADVLPGSMALLARRRKILAVTGLAMLLLVVSRLPTDAPSGSWEMPMSVLALGAVVGMTFGLLGAGLVIAYRTSRVVNFAHGEIGAFAAAVFGLLTLEWGLPYWVAFPLGLGAGAAAAALTEVVVVRRLRDAPRLMSMIATLGAGQVFFLLGSSFFSRAQAAHVYPEASGMPDFMLGALRVSPAHSGMLFISPILLASMAYFFKRTRLGVAIRCASSNPETARMVGIRAARMSSIAWAIAGVAAAFTAIMTQPLRGFTTAESFGPSLLLMALAAAVIARMSSITMAVIAGVALGTLEQTLQWNFRTTAVLDVVVFAVILVALLLQRQLEGREEEKGTWAAVELPRSLPREYLALWTVRNLGKGVGAVFALIALLLPLIVSSNAAITLTAIVAFAVVALSLVVTTGLGGQLTLGQFAVAAVGGVVSIYVSTRTGWFPLAFLYAGLASAITALVVGAPGLRIRGPLVAVTTLAFALAAPSGLLGQSFLLGDGVNPGRPVLWGNPLDTGKEYYYIGLFVLLISLLLVRNLGKSGLGRRFIAVRDNEDNARAFTVNASMAKIQGLMIGGFVAGLGGAVYAHLLTRVASDAFPATASIEVAKIAVIGGITLPFGPLLGSALVMALPAFVSLGNFSLFATSLGQLFVIMYLPRGLIQLVLPLRDKLAKRLARWAGVEGQEVDASEEAQDAEQRGALSQHVTTWGSRREGARLSQGSDGRSACPVVEVQQLGKSFGGVHAVREVSFDVREGEVLGIIGPNGAGKTTTFELVSGFVKPDRGVIKHQSVDVTRLSPEARGRRGLIRSFQDAALFPTMTVEEVLMLAVDRSIPARLLPSLAGVGTGEQRRKARAHSAIELMGLGSYRSKRIMELSTGTRRITELACLVLLQPSVLLLDEPSSGVAQRETEALGALLSGLRDEFAITMVIIEHDIPLITSIADRIVAMAEGTVVTVDSPDRVRNHPAVIESYLGTSATAIERSGDAVLSASP